MTGNELLKEALMLSLEETIAFHKQASKENPHRFSLAYKIRRRSIIRLAERFEAEKTHRETEKPRTERHFMPLKRLALFMAIIAAAVVLSVGAYAAYLIINGFVFDVHETHSDVTWDISDYDIKDSITELYWLPPESGWESVIELVDGELVISKYIRNEDMLMLMQYTKLDAEQSIGKNTENANIYDIKVNGNDGLMISRHREKLDNEKEIVWVINGYIFSISSVSISKNDLIKLAESVVIRENLE